MWDGIDRRKGTDWFDITINVFNLASWLVFLIALIVFHYARPEMEYIVYSLVSEPVEVRKEWIVELKQWLYICLYFCVLLSAITLLFNRTRMRRNQDRERYGMYLLLVVCCVFITVLLLG